MEENSPNKNILTLPLLITKGLVAFPSCPDAIEAGRAYSQAAIRQSHDNYNSLIFIGTQKDESLDEVDVNKDVYAVGTLARIVNMSEREDSIRIKITGSKRVMISAIRYEDGCYFAEGSIISEEDGDEKKVEASLKEVATTIVQTPGIARNIPKDVLISLDHVDSPHELCNKLGHYLPLEVKEKIAILEEPSADKRLKLIVEALKVRQQNIKYDNELEKVVREKAEQSQKEYYLREKMRAIKDELGEGKDPDNDEDSIRERLEKNPYPENVKKKVNSELKRYEMMPESSLESSLIMNYIQTLMNVPWYQQTEDNDDLDNVQNILDEDHYGLTKVKKRIIEYLAVKKSTGNLKAPILCFYGPPGCGKTSLAKSIARALGRKFYKCSLGGVNDEAEIRGHRRTYVGSMPGRIINGMNKAGVNNPLFLLDEIDKVGGSSYKGDPSSALLEVLDPEQNIAFNDNYLEEPYDLSNVLFIATANYLENVPAPLRDRLELIEVPSYTEIEKLKIATGFLIKKQMSANGLKGGDISFTEDGLKEMIECYSREAGVRELERLIASCCRKAVVELIKEPSTPRPIVVDKEQVKKYLGVEIFEDTKKEKEPQVGVVTGLAYTEFGGDILPIEVNYFHGKGGLVLTGKLGDVMKESCTIALDYVRANAKRYGIDDSIFESNDIHIHVPEGAVPKDGPSAGVAITSAIISSLTGKPIDNNVALTGEVTLRGKALPIGGLREKSLAALRSGIKTIIVPIDNKKDVSELPDEVKENLQIIYMKSVDDALPILIH